MKKIWLVIVFLAVFYGACFAEVYLIFDTATKSVYTISEKDDTSLPQGTEKVVLPGTIEQLGLTEHPSMYKFKNNKFINDSDKISNDELAKEKTKNKLDNDKLIAGKLRQMAITTLKADGVKLKEE
jgi:hypothetical protein